MSGRHLLMAAIAAAAWPLAAAAQQIDLSQGGPVTVTAAGGIDWDQSAQTVTAYDQARAVRGVVTVDAARLIAFYRNKKVAPGASPAAATTPGSAPSASAAAPDDSGNNEIYRLKAIGHVHIYTTTDQAWGDQALYDIDQSVLVLTGHALPLTTPTDVVTSRATMEYWPQIRRSVARGDAILTTDDGRRIQADILVGYSAPNQTASAGQTNSQPRPPLQTVAASSAKPQDPLTSSGKLKKSEAYGDVVVRTQTETVRGERGVYIPDTGIARIVGNVQITRGQNQLNGQAAIVNMRTGLATLTQDPGDRVQGLIVPNDQSPSSSTSSKGAAPTAGRRS